MNAGFKTPTESYFLNIPREVRDRIYETIRNDINSQGHTQLSQRPSTGFEGLWHVNRLIYHEVPQVLGTFAVPHKMVKTFLNRPITSHSAWNNFKFLYIEVPHNSDADTFRRLSHALKQVSYELRDLRLYGVGNDAHGRYTSSQTKACGKFDNSLFPRRANLAVSGQNWQLKLPLINAIQHLVGLRTLVLDNLNVPLLMAHTVAHKPHLQSLHIGTDHRTTLHSDYFTNLDAKRILGSLLFPLKEPLMGVKELHLTMNGSFHVGSIICLAAATLENLTVIVPDRSKQSACQPQQSWIEELAVIVNVLPLAKQLHTVKICVHEAISENSTADGRLIWEVKQSMPQLLKLRKLELHMNPRSFWVAQEFVDCLPPSLERLYLPEIFFNGCRQEEFEAMLQMMAGVTKITSTDLDYNSHQLIGEGRSRNDYIGFSRSSLCFIGYEYQVNLRNTFQEKDANTLLRLNAKLLDRHRNQHLADLKGGYIPLQHSKVSVSSEVYYAEVIAECAARLEAPMFDEIPEQHVFAADHEYFGNEKEAQEVFYWEPVACVGDLPPFTYPAFEDVPDDFKHSNHWISG